MRWFPCRSLVLSLLAVAAIASSGCSLLPKDGLVGGADDAGVLPGDCGASLYPPISSLVDDFSDGQPGAEWAVFGECAQETGGELLVQPRDELFCGYKTAGLYRLTCDAVTVRVPEVTASAGPGPQTFIYLKSEDGTQELLLLYVGSVFSFGELSLSYDPQRDLWWRLSEDGGDAVFSTSPDGASWLERGRVRSPMPLDAVRVSIGAGNWSAEVDQPGQARFDCFNLPASC